MANVIPAAVGGFASETLYVGDLDTNVKDDFFYRLFDSVAPVISFQICRDQTRKNSSLCHAFVKFRNCVDATIVMNRLYFTKINGKSIRIMFSHRIPSIGSRRNANVFVKNLNSSIDNEMLYQNFATFGAILSCKVAIDANGKSKGHGFVQFEKEESAQNAIKSLNGAPMYGKRVYVGPFLRRQERIQANRSPRFTDVYVKNLPEATTDEDLKQIFGTYGTISSAIVMRDSNGKSRCFGFVNFQNEDAAAAAVEKLNGTTVGDDKILYVGRARKKAERDSEFLAKTELERINTCEISQGSNLYIKNFDESTDDEKLKELFSKFGKIVSCKVMRDQDGLSMGFGFVAFSTPEEASRALNEMNGKNVGQKYLYVGVAQRKEERKAQFQRLFAQLQASANIPSLQYEIHGFVKGAPIPCGYGTFGFEHLRSTVPTAKLVAASKPSRYHGEFSSTADTTFASISPSSQLLHMRTQILRRSSPHPPAAHPAPSHASEVLNDSGDGPLDCCPSV